MNPELTAEALLQLVHRYYPVGLDNDDPRYKASEEGQRLQALIDAQMREAPLAWTDFIQRLKVEFTDCHIWDATMAWHEPCYNARVSNPGFVTGDLVYHEVVCLLSTLAPVYALYASQIDKASQPKPKGWLRFPPFPPELQAQEAKLAGLIEATFGYTRLPNDILFIPVPDLVPRSANYGLGEARLIDLLFTEHRW
jgi:hypothetical protein